MKRQLWLIAFLMTCFTTFAQTTTKVKYLTKSEFLAKVYNYEKNPTEWKYEGDKPCLIDFYASWCGPCKRLAPILEELAQQYEGEIYIYKVDIDIEMDLATAFGIQSIPTLFICPMNSHATVVKGLQPKDVLQVIIEEHLLGKK